MVVKLKGIPPNATSEFESRVILDGSQTDILRSLSLTSFESRVILDGSQTNSANSSSRFTFESRVILDGSQTAYLLAALYLSV